MVHNDLWFITISTQKCLSKQIVI